MLTEYELERQRRMKENKRRLDQLGLPQMLEEMQQVHGDGGPPKKKKQRSEGKNKAAAAEPTRRSSRNEGREIPRYSDRRGSPAERGRRDGPLVKEGECEEVYGVHHVRALGSTQQPWEMFQDGYNSSGERIYDSENGLSCHQCRQKTMGQRTSCSSCKSGLGVLCGDCLYARYGEHVEEAATNKNWVCPCCRDLCNCSRHRKQRKWEATGALHRSVKARGYMSVAHYLVLNKVGGLDAKRAALECGMCPPELEDKLRQEVKAGEAETAAAAAAATASGAAQEAEQAEAEAAVLQAAGGGTKGRMPAGGGKKQPAPAAVKKRAAKRGQPAEAAQQGATADDTAAAAGVLETSGAGNSGAVVAAAAAAAGDAGEVTAPQPHRAGKSGRKRAGGGGGATLEGTLVEPAPGRRGRQ